MKILLIVTFLSSVAFCYSDPETEIAATDLGQQFQQEQKDSLDDMARRDEQARLELDALDEKIDHERQIQDLKDRVDRLERRK